MQFGLALEGAGGVDLSAVNREALSWIQVFDKVFKKAQTPRMLEYVVHWTEGSTPGQFNEVVRAGLCPLLLERKDVPRMLLW